MKEDSCEFNNKSTKRQRFDIILPKRRETIETSDFSTSILVCPFALTKNTTKSENTLTETRNENRTFKNAENILPAFHDPLFFSYTFQFPEMIGKLLKDQEKLPFKYTIAKNCNGLEIIKDNVLTGKKCAVYIYGEPIPTDISISIILLHRKKYITKHKKLENQNYEECIKNKTKYIKSNIASEYKTMLLALQIKNKINIMYIESYDELICNLKNLIKESTVYVPKVKTFAENMKKEYFEYVLNFVPGIGKNVANILSNKFENINTFYEKLSLMSEMKIDKLANVVIVNEDKSGERILGERQAKMILRVFNDIEPNNTVN